MARRRKRTRKMKTMKTMKRGGGQGCQYAQVQNGGKRRRRRKTHKKRGGGGCGCTGGFMGGGSTVKKMAKAVVPVGLLALNDKKIYKHVKKGFNKTTRKIKNLFKF